MMIQAEPRLIKLLQLCKGNTPEIAVRYCMAIPGAVKFPSENTQFSQGIHLEELTFTPSNESLNFIKGASKRFEINEQEVILTCLKGYFRYLDDKGELFK